MKKMILALLVLACMACVALATDGVYIQWRTVYAGYTHFADDLEGEVDYILDHYSVTWQLIYAGANNQADPIDLNNSANGWVSGDDVVWASRFIAQGGGTADEWDNIQGVRTGTVWNEWLGYETGNVFYANPAWTTEGYFYQRVFEGDPEVGSYYFQTDLEPLVINPVTWQSHYPDTASAGFQPNMQIQAIPEPATMSLLGLGALALAIRRRRS